MTSSSTPSLSASRLSVSEPNLQYFPGTVGDLIERRSRAAAMAKGPGPVIDLPFDQSDLDGVLEQSKS